MGEAASRLSEDARWQLPEVPWRQLVAMRNRLIHADFDFDRDTVWKAATEEILALLVTLRSARFEGR